MREAPKTRQQALRGHQGPPSRLREAPVSSQNGAESARDQTRTGHRQRHRHAEDTDGDTSSHANTDTHSIAQSFADTATTPKRPTRTHEQKHTGHAEIFADAQKHTQTFTHTHTHRRRPEKHTHPFTFLHSSAQTHRIVDTLPDVLTETCIDAQTRRESHGTTRRHRRGSLEDLTRGLVGSTPSAFHGLIRHKQWRSDAQVRIHARTRADRDMQRRVGRQGVAHTYTLTKRP